MTKADQIQVDQMLAVADLLIKKATAIQEKGQPRKTGPRKGLSEAERKKVIAKLLKTALVK